MKKKISISLLICLVIVSLSTPGATAYAADKSDSLEGSIFADNVFYAEIPARTEYQLSDSQLNAPTAELVEAVLNYPFLVDLYSSKLNRLFLPPVSHLL